MGSAPCRRRWKAQSTRWEGGHAQALPELLSPADAAEALGVPEADILTAMETGDLPSKTIGASWRIRRADLDAFLRRP